MYKTFIMKTIMSTLFFAFAVFAASQAQSINNPQLVFKTDTHDFGEVKQGTETIYEFVFENKGSTPLIISNVEKQCGCTTPEWTYKPIKPGEKGVIIVKYDSNRIGPFNKSVTVHSNDSDNPQLILKIRGNVIGTDK